jgi:hypothetical protein
MTSWHFWEAVRWDLPAVVMVAMLLIFIWTLYRTQQQADFNFADMYRGDDGKPSTGRVVAVGAWVVSSWVVMQDTLDAVPTWSAAKPLEKFADKWDGALPLTKKT